MRSRDKVSIGWCDPGTVDGMFAARLFMLAQQRASILGPTVRIEGSALISRERNELVSAFLDKTDSAWLLMLDADQQLPVDAFDKLVATAHDTDRPIVAGLYFGAFNRGDLYPTPVPLIYRMSEHGLLPVVDYPHDSVIPVDAAGTGCLLIHRSILMRMREQATADEGAHFCWFQDRPVNGTWQGEDIYFCTRARMMGVPIVAHTGAVLPHRKRYWLTDAHFGR